MLEVSNLQRAVDFLVSIVEDKGTLSLKSFAFLFPIREINEVLVVFAQLLNNFLIPFELSAHVLHGVQNEDAIRDVIVLVSCEPVGENGIRGSGFLVCEFHDLDARALQGLLEVIEFYLCLQN